MSWEEDLFAVLDDLEQQAEAAYGAERAAELADRSRAEYQQVTLDSRLMASLDTQVALDVTGVGRVGGTLERVATGWCVVRGAAQDWVVSTDAISAVGGTSPRSLPEVAWPAVSRLSIASALRRLADEGERCVLHGVDGARHEGRISRVGADFVELLLDGTHRTLLVALPRLAAVQSRD